MALSKPLYPVIPTDEDIQIHVEAVHWLGDADHDQLSKIGIRIHRGNCNPPHKLTTKCNECRWGFCQCCGEETTEDYSNWTFLCNDCRADYQLPDVPDNCKQFYPEWAYKTFHTLKPFLSGGGGDSPPPPDYLPCSSDDDLHPYAGSSAADTTRILISSDDEMVVKKEDGISDEDLTETEKADKTFRKLHPHIPGHFVNGPEYNPCKKKEILIFKKGYGAGIKEARFTQTVKDVFVKLDTGIKLCHDRTNPLPPQHFMDGIDPESFEVNEIYQLQDPEQVEKFKMAVQQAHRRNTMRPIGERVAVADIESDFIHGSNLKQCRSIFNDSLRQTRSIVHYYGYGLYGSEKVLGVPLMYAAKFKDNLEFTKEQPALLLCSAVIGRKQLTHDRDDKTKEGYDCGGCGNLWVITLFDIPNLLPKFIVTLNYLAKDADGRAKFQIQLDMVLKANEAFYTLIKPRARSPLTIQSPGADSTTESTTPQASTKGKDRKATPTWTPNMRHTGGSLASMASGGGGVGSVASMTTGGGVGSVASTTTGGGVGSVAAMAPVAVPPATGGGAMATASTPSKGKDRKSTNAVVPPAKRLASQSVRSVSPSTPNRQSGTYHFLNHSAPRSKAVFLTHPTTGGGAGPAIGSSTAVTPVAVPPATGGGGARATASTPSKGKDSKPTTVIPRHGGQGASSASPTAPVRQSGGAYRFAYDPTAPSKLVALPPSDDDDSEPKKYRSTPPTEESEEGVSQPSDPDWSP